jgi:hypothetical protein
MAKGRNVGGTIYACPADLIAARCPKYFPARLAVVPLATGSSASPSLWPTSWDFTAYIAERRAGFVGRNWLFAEVEQWLVAPDVRARLITADYGVGKTAFLAEFVARDRARTGGTRVAAHHFCQRTSAGTLDPMVFVRSLAAQLRESIPRYAHAMEALPGLVDQLAGRTTATYDLFDLFDACIANPLHRVSPPDSPHVIVIDAPSRGCQVDLSSNRARQTPRNRDGFEGKDDFHVAPQSPG